MSTAAVKIRIPRPFPKQAEFIDCEAKRVVVKAGRRSGKTKGFAIRAVKRFLKKRRQIYAAPTAKQMRRFWSVVCRALAPLIAAGILEKNETYHMITFPGTDISIEAQTAWNPSTLRGDWCHDLYLDEYQLMAESTWDSAGAPLLVDKNGDACFGFTPPSLHSEGASKADDPQHAAKFYKRAQADTSGRYKTFRFTTFDNPHVSQQAIREMAQDMTALSYRIEILAEDTDQSPGALWTRGLCEAARYPASEKRPEFDRVVVAVDPSTTADGNATGIVGVGRYKWGGYVLEDASTQGTPTQWATAAVNLYRTLKADCIAAEANQGGQMITTIIAGIDPDIKVKLVYASRGKQARAEPVAAFFEVDEIKPVRRGFFCGSFPHLEDELCTWEPGNSESPNRLDAMVWGFTELLIASRPRKPGGVVGVGHG